MEPPPGHMELPPSISLRGAAPPRGAPGHGRRQLQIPWREHRTDAGEDDGRAFDSGRHGPNPSAWSFRESRRSFSVALLGAGMTRASLRCAGAAAVASVYWDSELPLAFVCRGGRVSWGRQGRPRRRARAGSVRQNPWQAGGAEGGAWPVAKSGGAQSERAARRWRSSRGRRPEQAAPVGMGAGTTRRANPSTACEIWGLGQRYSIVWFSSSFFFFRVDRTRVY